MKKEYTKPATMVVRLNTTALLKNGSHVDSIIPTVQGPCSLEYAMEHAEELYESAALRTFKLLKVRHE